MATRFELSAATLRRENLLQFVTQRFPSTCPLLTLLPRDSTVDPVIEFGVDSPFDLGDDIRNIADPHATAKLSGDDFTDVDTAEETRLKAVCETKSRSTKMVGELMPIVSAGGPRWDRAMSRLMIQHLNDIDNTALWGMGGPVTDGLTIPNKTQGLVSLACITGLERMHGDGSVTSITDPTGQSIPQQYWSVAFDAEHNNLTCDMMFEQLIRPLLDGGAQMSSGNGWNAMCGYKMMGRIARFNQPGAGIVLEERTRPAGDGMGADYMRVFKFPTGEIISFMTNRWMDRDDQQFEFGSAHSFTPGTPATPGSVAVRTFDGDSALLVWEPGSHRIRWYRDPAYRLLPSTKDESRIGVLSQFMVQGDHPLCIGFIGNALG